MSERVVGAPSERPSPGDEREGDELRSVAQLKMLHSLAARLGGLQEVADVGEAITAELHTLIDYHSCRVYLLQPDGRTLFPIAFRGRLTDEYEGETIEQLLTEVGEGITGRVAETRRSFLAENARYVDWAVQIPGTDDIDESMLAVPMLHGERVVGVIVLSALGEGRFDGEDQRLLEVLAGHAAVAFENARLLQLEREAARTSSALLGLSQSLTGARDPESVLEHVCRGVPDLVATSFVGAYVRDEVSGTFHLAAAGGPLTDRAGGIREVSGEAAAGLLASVDEPFVIPREVVSELPREWLVAGAPREGLVAPLRWDPDGFGAIVLVAPEDDASFSGSDVRLAGGIADITALAMGRARRFHELERFHNLVGDLDAVFWEAEADTLAFTFVSSGAAGVLGRVADAWLARPGSWGDHIDPDDRELAVDACRLAALEHRDVTIEYRVLADEGDVRWIRDMVNVVEGAAGGPGQLRGLMIDITERKRAEEALMESERRYSDAFRREREATQRLRALDEMKNTFLEAVSHDLRTPLTSILGSALTLEQAGLGLPEEDALDLIRRIATNARKLERLLSDLLDLDRLQRGILTPQRRPTDVTALVRQVVGDAEGLVGRQVDIDAEPVIVPVDAAKVERIVENLITNAARHTPPGTPVTIRVKGQDEGVLITVEDRGSGVPEEFREAVFEPFEQGAPPTSHSPGVGVGLSLVARFAELHGGRAWVEEREGGGASFHVFLPAAADEAA
jgi:signal transduction histidine kinase/putative methionine-R-sulfoxide reductase with GAF domain